MLIECRIQRERRVTLGDETYRFRRNDRGRYVAVVGDEDHIRRLLDIECYYPAVLDPDDAPARVSEPEPEPESSSNTLGPEMDLAAAQMREDRIEADEAQAQQDDTTGEDDGEEAEAVEQDEAADQDEGEAEPAPEEPSEREQLRARYKELYGKNPRYNLSNAKVQQAIDDKLAESE